MSQDYTTITFDVVNGDWQIATGSPNQQVFNLNEVYTEWYQHIHTTYNNSLGNPYGRIRWGNSAVRQDQVFDAGWLTVCQITETSNTLINGSNNKFTLGGDI